MHKNFQTEPLYKFIAVCMLHPRKVNRKVKVTPAIETKAFLNILLLQLVSDTSQSQSTAYRSNFIVGNSFRSIVTNGFWEFKLVGVCVPSQYVVEMFACVLDLLSKAFYKC